MPVINNFSIVAGTDAIIDMALTPPESTSGWTLKFAMTRVGTKRPIGSELFSLPSNISNLQPGQMQQIGDMPVGAIITKEMGASGISWVNQTIGTFQITLSSSDTKNVSPGIYSFGVWRVDSGNSIPLSHGVIHLTPANLVP